MARIFNDGAEMLDTCFWDGEPGRGYAQVQTATPNPFLGEAYYEINGYTQYMQKSFTALSELYFRQRFYYEAISSAPSGGAWFPKFRAGATQVCALSVDNLFHWTAYGATSAAVLEDSGVVASGGQWYQVQIYLKIADAPNGRFVVWIDENKLIDFTGDTKTGADTTIDNIRYEPAGSAGGSEILRVDDLAMNDTTGAADNSYCGDGSYVKVYPDGNGTHNNWHGSDGNDVDNYLLCDEFPKDDDTTYVYHDNTSGTQQQFAMSHLSFTGYTIRRLYAEARARKTAATAMTLKLGQLAAGGADVVSAGRVLYTNAYTRIVGDDALVNPVDGNPWEEADIDAIEFVAQVT
jgi:hypothetical protein